MYDDLEYAKGRLEDTIVRVGNEPLHVEEVFYSNEEDESMSCTGHLLFSGKAVQVSLSDIILESSPLGYVNHTDEQEASYFVRKPMRNDWRQGLRPGNMTVCGKEVVYRSRLEDLAYTIKGIYPTIKECNDMLDRGWQVVAFCRDFALSQTKKIFYKGRPVGTYDKMFTLDEKYKYLSEYLNEAVNDQSG